ncbi:hypothetical protein ONZ45_g13738 [Pleurotus djamor]|nr:hypothetical protein ONZ45_g13738 [Pleurotus djamor]
MPRFLPSSFNKRSKSRRPDQRRVRFQNEPLYHRYNIPSSSTSTSSLFLDFDYPSPSTLSAPEPASRAGTPKSNTAGFLDNPDMNSPYLNSNYLLPAPITQVPAPIMYQATPVVQAQTERTLLYTPATTHTPMTAQLTSSSQSYPCPHQHGYASAAPSHAMVPTFTPNPYPSAGQTIFVPAGPSVSTSQHQVQYLAHPPAGFPQQSLPQHLQCDQRHDGIHHGIQQQPQPFVLTPLSPFNSTPLPVPHAISTFTPAPQAQAHLMTFHNPNPHAPTSLMYQGTPMMPPQLNSNEPSGPAFSMGHATPMTYLCTPVPSAPA